MRKKDGKLEEKKNGKITRTIKTDDVFIEYLNRTSSLSYSYPYLFICLLFLIKRI